MEVSEMKFPLLELVFFTISLSLSPIRTFFSLVSLSRMLCHNLIFDQIIQEINTLQVKHTEGESRNDEEEDEKWKMRFIILLYR